MATAKSKNTRNNKSSGKSVKSKKSIFSNLYFGSKKAQFLMVIISFALIGGGFMVYKSFAATPLITLSGSADFQCQRKCSKPAEAQKSNQTVLSLTSGPIRGSSQESGLAHATRQVSLSRGYKYDFCFMVSGKGNLIVAAHQSNFSGTPSIFHNIEINNSSYSERCLRGIASSGTGNHSIALSQIDTNGILNISSMNITPSALPISTGGPTK